MKKIILFFTVVALNAPCLATGGFLGLVKNGIDKFFHNGSDNEKVVNYLRWENNNLDIIYSEAAKGLKYFRITRPFGNFLSSKIVKYPLYGAKILVADTPMLIAALSISPTKAFYATRVIPAVLASLIALHKTSNCAKTTRLAEQRLKGFCLKKT